MTVEQWEIAIGMVVSAMVAVAPWMLKVHAKLAVLGQQMTAVEIKVDKLLADYEHRLSMCTLHQVRLETVETGLDDLTERLREIE